MFTLISNIKEAKKKVDKEQIIKNLEIEDPKLLEQLKRVYQLCYRSDYNYFISDVIYECDGSNDYSLNHGLNFLEFELATRNITGHLARGELNRIISGMSEDDGKVLRLIIKRNLNIAFGASSFNKIYPDMIYIHPYHGCSSFNKKNLSKIKFPAFSQDKEDGLFIDIFCRQTEVIYMTRSGNVLDLNSDLDADLLLTYPEDDMVIKGEALMVNPDGTLMERTEGNGELNSDDLDINKIVFIVWDVVRLEEHKANKSIVPYEARFFETELAVERTNNSKLRLIKSRIVNSVEELIAHFNEAVALGKEGTVVKNLNTEWKDGRSANMVKIKIVFECDLLITGYKEGSGKNVGRLGAFVCRSSDGLLEVSIGGGYSDKERISYWENRDSLVGMIIVCKGNDVVSSEQKPGMKSIFLPRQGSAKIRKDKIVADTLVRVIEQKDSFMDMLKAIQ